MVGGRLHCVSCLFKCNALLLLWVCLYDVQALSCQHALHKKVGDTVELSSCLPTEGVTVAKWRYGGSIIADKDKTVDEKQFKGRLKLDPTSFSLTVKDLTLQDSGEFIFTSDGKTQMPSVTVTLKVHDSITKQPNLTGNSTWQTSTNSCAVMLQCSVNSDIDVSYKWTVGNEIRNGPMLQYNLSTQDGDTEFTCTIYNPVSQMSTSRTMTCTIDTQEINTKEERATDVESIDHTLYADINDVAIEAGNLSTMKPCSVYETIENKDEPVTPVPQTVYDKIQLNRMRTASGSPYQDIS
ncbi:CD48 antigen [Tautogolabrus adspersus]